ncbi:MAG: glycosyltransferase family 4 protein [Bacteroidales bacterium]|nr:glycosyltransferase family 4 protein [Bacteroidales bacterium]
MNIGIIIGRIGGVDGVALETEKWIEVFQKMGHKVYTISGQFEGRKINHMHETRVQEMSFFSPESYWEQKKAFFHPDFNQDELIEHIHLYSKVIEQKIVDWTQKYKIDLILSENASALPSHISMGLAIKNAVKKLNIPTITHDHDFAWERGDRYNSPHSEINKLINEVFPLQLPNSFHAVINLHAQKTLKERFNRDSVVVPNVMDFSKPYAQINNHNKNIKQDLGLDDDDILLFQITRIVERKGIETAIRLIHMLNNPKIKLIITGNYADDAGSIYYTKLVDLIHELKLSKQIHFAYHSFSTNLISESDNNKLYSLSDAYAHARACTYFSTYEGFGNAFVEAVLAKCPIFVNNYKPVYWPDIGSKGFNAVMLEDNVITDKALREIEKVIFDDKLNDEIGKYNFELGKKYFSYDTLEKKLTELIELSKKM